MFFLLIKGDCDFFKNCKKEDNGYGEYEDPVVTASLANDGGNLVL